MAKPIVDGLEADLQGRAAVLRLDILTGVGREAMRRYGVIAVPTTFLFDGKGQPVLRQVGLPDASAIQAGVAALGEVSDDR